MNNAVYFSNLFVQTSLFSQFVPTCTNKPVNNHIQVCQQPCSSVLTIFKCVTTMFKCVNNHVITRVDVCTRNKTFSEEIENAEGISPPDSGHVPG